MKLYHDASKKLCMTLKCFAQLLGLAQAEAVQNTQTPCTASWASSGRSRAEHSNALHSFLASEYDYRSSAGRRLTVKLAAVDRNLQGGKVFFQDSLWLSC